MPTRDEYRRRTSDARAERTSAKLRLAIERCAVGQFLAEAREERGLLQSEVAQHVGRTQTVISRVEMGLGGFQRGNDLIDRILDYLEQMPVIELTGNAADDRPLRARLESKLGRVRERIQASSGDADLEALLLQVQKDSRRTLPPVLVKTHSSSLVDQFDLDPNRGTNTLRIAQASTRAVMAAAVDRADTMPLVEARLYLTQLRSIVSALPDLDSVSLEAIESFMRNLPRSRA